MRINNRIRPFVLAEIFALGNIGFLAADVYIAHSVNAFEREWEWIPVGFSIFAPIILLIAMVLGGIEPQRNDTMTTSERVSRYIGLLVGWCSLSVGVAGLLFHLQSHFFESETVKSLVYTAPFVAPLAYAGLGLLLIMDRMVPSDSVDWPRWVALLALGGFFGNFILSLADHAQNAFFNATEWIAVAAAALACGFLLLEVIRPFDRLLMKATVFVMIIEMFVGVAGFVLHVRSNLARPDETVWERFLYGAPAFAPLLFPNLALLALIGLWALSRMTESDEDAMEISDEESGPIVLA